LVLEYHKWQLIGITLYITKQINISKYIFFITHTSHNNIHIFIDRLFGDIFLFITHTSHNNIHIFIDRLFGDIFLFITHTSHNNIHIFIDRLVGDIFLFITHIYLDKGGTFTNMSHLLIFFTEEGDSRTQEMEKKCLLLQQHVHEMEV
jgi:hypothetical protein